MAERVYPHNLEAERAVIGASLVNPQAFGEAIHVIEPAHFYRDAHRRIWTHMRALAGRNIEPDLLTLKEALTTAGELDDIGGPVYLASLTDGVPRSTNVVHYAGIVVEKSRLRSAIMAANQILQSAYDAEDDARDVLDRAEQALFALSDKSKAGGFRKLAEILPGLMDQIEAWSTSKTGVTGLSTGFVDLDAMTRGLQKQNLIVLAARPAMGKSTLAENIAVNVAARGGTVGCFSFEMSMSEWAIRALVAEARIDSHRLQRGWVKESDWGRIAQAMGTLDQYPLYVDDTPFLTVFDIRARARRLKAERGLSLIVVDYMQLVDTHEKRDNRALELGTVSRMLKAIAKELDVPVMALSQLSRKVEERTDKTPMLSDLRESGALEQDADTVWFIHRPAVYSATPTGDYAGMSQTAYETLANVIIAKHRNGPTGTVEMNFFGHETRFSDRADVPQAVA